MKRLIKIAVLLIIPAFISINAYAQANVVVDLDFLAEGTKFDGDRVCALMTDVFLASDDGQSLLTRIQSFRVNDAYSSEAEQARKGLKGLKDLRMQYVGKTDQDSLDLLKHLDEEISHYEKIIRQLESMATGGSGNAEALIEEARSHSAGGRLYYGAAYIDHGCWAVGVSKEYKTPDSKYGVINSAGEVVVPFEYNYLEAYPDIKMLKTCDFRNRKEGAIRYDGSVVLDCKYDIVNCNYSSFVIIDNNGNDSRCGVADLSGKIVIPQIYKEIEPFKYNLKSGSYEFYVVTDAKTKLKAVFDQNFKQITGFIYDGWINEQPYFIGVKPEGNNDVFDARRWQKLDRIPEEYWNHRFEEIEGK